MPAAETKWHWMGAALDNVNIGERLTGHQFIYRLFIQLMIDGTHI